MPSVALHCTLEYVQGVSIIIIIIIPVWFMCVCMLYVVEICDTNMIDWAVWLVCKWTLDLLFSFFLSPSPLFSTQFEERQHSRGGGGMDVCVCFSADQIEHIIDQAKALNPERG